MGLVEAPHYVLGILDPPQLILLMAVALIVFGPKKLPEIGRGLGHALREFNKAKADFMDSLNAEMEHVESSASTTYHAPSTAPDGTAHYDAGTPSGHALEYPKPLEPEHADALPYGGEFHAVEGDSQPSFRTAQPETASLSSAAPGSAHPEVGKG